MPCTRHKCFVITHISGDEVGATFRCEARQPRGTMGGRSPGARRVPRKTKEPPKEAME